MMKLALPAVLLVAAPALVPSQARRIEDPIRLPYALEGLPEPGLLVQIDRHGRVQIDGAIRHQPGDDRRVFTRWMQQRVRWMPTRRNDDLAMDLPAERVLLHVDQDAPFESVQRVLATCAEPGVLLWRTELAVLLPNDGGSAYLPIHLPTDNDMVLEEVEEAEAEEEGDDAFPEPEDAMSVTVRVVDRGFAGEPGEPDTARPRVLEYAVGLRKTGDVVELARWLDTLGKAGGASGVVIDPHPGTNHADVVEVIDIARGAGFRQLMFTGPRN